MTRYVLRYYHNGKPCKYYMGYQYSILEGEDVPMWTNDISEAQTFPTWEKAQHENTHFLNVCDRCRIEEVG